MIAAGAALEKVAGPLERAQAQLHQAVANAGFEFDDFAGRIKMAEDKQVHFGHTQADTDQALQKFRSHS